MMDTNPIEDYIAHKRKVGSFRSQRTVNRTHTALTEAANTLDLLAAEEAEIAAYLLDYGEAHAPSTTGLMHSTLQGFYTWALRSGRIDVDPMFEVARPRTPKGANRSLNRSQIEEVRAVAARNGLRGRLIFSLLYGEGLRVSEVAAIRVEDITETHLHVRGKGYGGEVSRKVALSPPTQILLPLYRRHLGIDDGHLIRNNNDRSKPTTGQAIGEAVSGWMARAGVKTGAHDGYSAHALRHTAAQEMMGASDLTTTSQFLGHANLATTSSYLRRLAEGQPEAQAARFAS